MAKKAKAGDSQTTNLSETKDTIRDVVPRIINLKADRKEINAAIQELREKVNAAGVPKAALDYAIRMKEMDPEDRQRHDEGCAIARDALTIGFQRSLFEMIEDPAGTGTGTGNGSIAAAKAHLGTDATESATA